MCIIYGRKAHTPHPIKESKKDGFLFKKKIEKSNRQQHQLPEIASEHIESVFDLNIKHIEKEIEKTR